MITTEERDKGIEIHSVKIQTFDREVVSSLPKFDRVSKVGQDQHVYYPKLPSPLEVKSVLHQFVAE